LRALHWVTTASTSESFRNPIQPRKPLSTLRWRSQGGVANRILCVEVRTWRTQGRFRRASAVDQADKEDLSFFADEYVVSIKNPSRFSHQQTGVDMSDAQDPHDCGSCSSTGAVQSGRRIPVPHPAREMIGLTSVMLKRKWFSGLTIWYFGLPWNSLFYPSECLPIRMTLLLAVKGCRSGGCNRPALTCLYGTGYVRGCLRTPAAAITIERCTGQIGDMGGFC
jgi:hypothetical protein